MAVGHALDPFDRSFASILRTSFDPEALYF